MCRLLTLVLCSAFLAFGSAAFAEEKSKSGSTTEAAAPLGAPHHDVQAALWDWGYDTDTTDPSWDATDAAALKIWQADWEMEPTGEVTETIASMLLRAHPSTAPGFFPSKRGCLAYDHFPQARSVMTWTGSCLDGKTAGVGQLVWTYWYNGAEWSERYDGSMQGGYTHGQGTYLFESGNKYVGGFFEGALSGTGSMIYSDGQNYTGSWKSDLPNGPGTFVDQAGQIFTGTWRNGCLQIGDRWAAVETSATACGFD
ncbi:MAG: hypothetical protein AAF666_04210 [Pseudomonadota bacterium]